MCAAGTRGKLLAPPVKLNTEPAYSRGRVRAVKRRTTLRPLPATIARRPGLAAPRVARASRSCGWWPLGRRPRPDALVDHQPPLGPGVDLPPQVRKRLHHRKDERLRIEGLSPLEDQVLDRDRVDQALRLRG